MPGVFQRPSLAVLNGPFSSDADSSPVGVSFGADAEIARRTRQMALDGFTAAMERSRMAAEPSYLQDQRRNIAAHGTIENPDAYKRRTGQESAAELLDPSNPMGALRQDTQRQELAKAELAPGGLRSTQLAGENALALGRMKGDIDREVAGIRASSDEYGSEVEAAQRERANLLDNLFGSLIPPEVARDPKRRAEALNAVLSELHRYGVGGAAQ